MILTAQEYYQRGTVPAGVGRYAQAIEFVDRALKCDPRYTDLLVALP